MKLSEHKKELALAGAIPALAALLTLQLLATLQKPSENAAANISPNGQRAELLMNELMTDQEFDDMLAAVSKIPEPYDQQRVGRDAMEAVPLMIPIEGRPQQTIPTTVPDLNLSAIIYDSQRPVAVINQHVVGVGDELSAGIKVDNIEKDQVIFQIGDYFYPKKLKEL